ncbi:MAG: 6,7-dimethyl-8-ribityllumazine synthase [Chitinophagales bacterium]|jgi:6,7-dimethyl-8-ribityllumazine synthase|nr:6,7-dimethyl-8-ribityllumazine synthase [Chitinophagales bacterium]
MNTDLSKLDLPAGDFSAVQIAIVVSEYHADITGQLSEGCRATLLQAGVRADNIRLFTAPGAYELPITALYADNATCSAVVCLGCVIKGDTDHDVYINHAVADGLMKLSLERNKPFVFGLLTTNNLQQALDRAGGRHGNKGVECALAALKMIAIKQSL